MVTADKSRFNRRRMYLISNEFTLPAFSGGPAAPHRRGFYLVKKGFARVEHRRNSGRTESSLEFNSRTRASGGAHGFPPDSPLSLSPSFRIIRNNSSYLSSVSARYRTCMYMVKLRMRPPRKWAAELDDFLVFSSATNYLFRASRSWQTAVARATLRENTAKKFVQNAVSTVVVFAVGWYKVRTVFWWSSALRLIPLTGAKEYYFSANE